MALMRGTRGWKPRKGRKATLSRSHPQEGGRTHPQGKGQEEIDFPGGQEQHRHKGAAHVDFPLGEIDQAQNAIDHGIAQGDEGINTAGGQAVDQLLEKHQDVGIIPLIALDNAAPRQPVSPYHL